jgi:competence ComEA-like helix-hairpin-helix protein
LPGETAEAKLETDDEELPEWLRELEEAQATEESVEEPTEVPEAAAEPETVAAEEAEEEEELPEWLRDLEAEPEEEEIPWEPEEVTEVPAEAPEAEKAEDEYVWQPPEVPVEEAEEIEPEEVEPEDVEPVELNTASLADLEKIPGIGFRLAQHIINYRQESGPYETVKDLLNVSTIGADVLKQISDYIVVEAPQPEEAPVEPDIEPEDEHHAKQLQAQAHLKKGNIDEAMELYDQLIKKSKRVKEIIEDLNQASYQHPVNANILQTLGDAYMRDDQLQEALDTYSKAENLLR